MLKIPAHCPASNRLRGLSQGLSQLTENVTSDVGLENCKLSMTTIRHCKKDPDRWTT
jgi:hypothetical protein